MGTYSAFRIPHFAFGEGIHKVVRQADRHRQVCREVVGVKVIHEQHIVVHRLGREQSKIQITAVLESAPERVSGKQARRRHG